MRTNIVLDDTLVAKAMKVSRMRTKKDIVTIALKEFISNHSRLDIRKLKGKISFHKGYDYKAMREV